VHGPDYRYHLFWSKTAEKGRGGQDLFIFDRKSNQSLDLLFLILDFKRSIFFKIKD
jgi:hypothetical protein